MLDISQICEQFNLKQQKEWARCDADPPAVENVGMQWFAYDSHTLIWTVCFHAVYALVYIRMCTYVYIYIIEALV